MNAIPTRYSGVQFRSRLEARWAALFDLVMWKWDYEPFDLAGWIPDFYVRPWGSEGGFLVEVKPFNSLDDFDVDFYRRQLSSCGIPRCEGVALLGVAVRSFYLCRKPGAPDEDLEAAQLGWFVNAHEGLRVGPNYYETIPREYQYKPDQVNPLFLHGNAEGYEGESFWKQAGNLVQWNGPSDCEKCWQLARDNEQLREENEALRKQLERSAPRTLREPNRPSMDERRTS